MQLPTLQRAGQEGHTRPLVTASRAPQRPTMRLPGRSWSSCFLYLHKEEHRKERSNLDQTYTGKSKSSSLDWNPFCLDLTRSWKEDLLLHTYLMRLTWYNARTPLSLCPPAAPPPLPQRWEIRCEFSTFCLGNSRDKVPRHKQPLPLLSHLTHLVNWSALVWML